MPSGPALRQLESTALVGRMSLVLMQLVGRGPARALTGALLIGALLSLGAGSVIAAQATPTPAATPANRLSCPVEPVTADRLIAALEAATPQPLATLTMETLPAGGPVDQATLEAVTATVTTALDCRNAGNFARVYTLFSDNMIGQVLGNRYTVPPEIVAALQEAPRRVRPPFRVTLVELSDAIQLPDGRVGAVVVTANATHSFTDFLAFVDEDGTWLIDEAISISATFVAATPMPERAAAMTAPGPARYVRVWDR